MKSIIFSVSILLTLVQFSIARWGEAPQGWDDFKFALLDGNTSPFKNALANAIDAGIQIDYSYVYITTLADIDGFLFAPWFNYATSRPGDVKPSITIYMLQQGQDSPDGAPALSSAADANYMKRYFEGIVQIADSAKGTSPIYVIEPDVWGYLLGQANPTMTEDNLSKICHINDLGLDWLSEFDNRMDNLPAAIIKTLKLRDSGCYAGILMAHWGMPDDVPSAIEDGKISGQFISKFLKEPYRGDFIGIEKNGTDAGSWSATSDWHWSDTKNEAFLGWCKALGQETDLPLFGWQISTGYKDVAGYDNLPNTSGRYSDTYFQYFFDHVTDFIDAGFIGFDAGCNNQGVGTWASLKNGEGDNGWFLNNLKEFNKHRPYDLNLVTSIPSTGVSSKQINSTYIINKNSVTFSINSSVNIYSVSGKLVVSQNLLSGSSINLSPLSRGVYLLKVENDLGVNSIKIKL